MFFPVVFFHLLPFLYLLLRISFSLLNDDMTIIHPPGSVGVCVLPLSLSRLVLLTITGWKVLSELRFSLWEPLESGRKERNKRKTTEPSIQNSSSRLRDHKAGPEPWRHELLLCDNRQSRHFGHNSIIDVEWRNDLNFNLDLERDL